MAKKTVYMQTERGDVFSTTSPEYHKDCRVLPRNEGAELYREQEIANLKKWIKPGTTIYTKLETVSASGMSRRISVYAVPAIAIHPPDSHYDILFETLTHQHGADAVCAAFLLVHGRRALRAYNLSRGRYADVLVPLLTDAVGTWTDTKGGDRAAVSLAADTLVAHLLAADYSRSSEPANDTISTSWAHPKKQ